jgi:O-antigen/teichoic acid export membrane protein
MRSVVRFLTKSSSSRTLNAKRNIFASFAIKGVSMLIGLMLVPMTIHYVSITEYGIWITLSSIVGWIGFFDIGLGNGLRNKFAEAVAKKKYKLAKIYVSTTYAIVTIIISIVLSSFLIVNPFLDWSLILNTSKTMREELSALALIVFAFFSIQFVLKLITTIVTANQQPAKASLFNLIGSVFSLILIFILTKTTSGNLIYLGWVLGASPVVVLIVSSIWFYSHEYKKFAPSFAYVRFKYAKNLLSIGVQFFIIQIAAVLIYQTTNMIITQLYGPSEVTPYNIAFRYFGVIPMVFSIVMSPFWSAFTEAWVLKDMAWIKSTVNKLRIVWIFTVGICLIMLLFSNILYKAWVGNDIIVPISVSICVAIYVIVNAWNAIYSQFLNGIGRIKLQLYVAVIGSAINIPLAIVLGKSLGVYGIVLSSIIICLMPGIYGPIQYYKIISGKARGIWDK